MIGDVNMIKRVIKDQVLTHFFARTMDREKIDYFVGTPAQCAEKVDHWVQAIANGTVFTIECWSGSTKSAPGTKGGKDSDATARCIWTVQGRNGAPVTAMNGHDTHAAAPPGDGDLRERMARMEAQLEFEKQLRQRAEEELADLEEEEEDDDGDEEEEGEITGVEDPKMVLINKLIDIFAPKIAPRPAAPGVITGTGDDPPREVIEAWKRMKQADPAMAADLESKLLVSYGTPAPAPAPQPTSTDEAG